MNARFKNRAPKRENVLAGFAWGTILWLPYSLSLIIGLLVALVMPKSVIAKWIWNVIYWFDGPRSTAPKTFYFTALCWLLGAGAIAMYAAYLAVKIRNTM